MQYALTLIALAASAVVAVPPGCQKTYSGSFEIAPVNISSATKRDLLPRQATCDTNPIITLNNGILIDQQGRQGEIVANAQFQFDSPIQADSLSLDGFSVCPNNTLATGDSTIFYGCKSGDFSNLYSKSLGGQCYPIFIEILPCSGGTQPQSKALSSPLSSGGAGPASTSAPASTTSSSTYSYVTPTSSMTPYLPAMPTPGAPTPAPVSSAAPVAPAPVAPYPVGGNATTPVASGKPSGTGAGTSKTSPLTAPANGAETLVIGAKLLVAAVGVVAFAML